MADICLSLADLWTECNTQQNTPDPTIQTNTALRETTAQTHHIYRLIDDHLSVYDRNELVKETLAERLLLPEHINRLWAKLMFSLIYKRIRLQRKFFTVSTVAVQSQID